MHAFDEKPLQDEGLEVDGPCMSVFMEDDSGTLMLIFFISFFWV